MKKNRMMRLASILLICVLLTTSVISGTFAKYSTHASSNDLARVANWGFERTNSMDLTDLFLGAYANVRSQNSDNVIAPGTSGETSFQFAYDETNGTKGPEVAYEFRVEVMNFCAESIKNNKNIQWKLDDGEWGTWDEMIAGIKALSGDPSGIKRYSANTLPEAFGTGDPTHTIYWQWIFFTDYPEDTVDTTMGNADELDECRILISITAEQVD